MRKVAIIKTSDKYINYDDYEKIVESITDWTEIEDADYDLLDRNLYRIGYDYILIEQPLNQKEFIKNTVSDIKEKIQKQIAQEKARRTKAQKDAAKRKADRERKQFEKLKAKFENA